MKEVEYIKFMNFKPITLDGLYDGSLITNLDYNIYNIVNTEYPITLNTLKERLREALNVKKISQKALDLINESILRLGLEKTDNLYDVVYWPKGYNPNYDVIRVSKRQIYDIPFEEIKNVFEAYIDNYSKEDLYRKILAYFGYEVLTSKAYKYLEYVENRLK